MVPRRRSSVSTDVWDHRPSTDGFRLSYGWLMLKKGQTVTTLTAKIGAPTRLGRILEVHGEFVDVEWEDGHVSTLTRESVVPAHHEKERVGR